MNIIIIRDRILIFNKRMDMQVEEKVEKKKKHRSSTERNYHEERDKKRQQSPQKKHKNKDKKKKSSRSVQKKKKSSRSVQKKKKASRSAQKKKKHRSKSKKHQRGSQQRSRSLAKKTKEKPRQDKWRKEREMSKFRYDSPPKSDESDMSQDPQKMEKLNRMKASKELVSSKADRKLYLGNLPPNITAPQLMQTLNSALKKMQINTDMEGDSIISAWISPDGVGHYAFVQFRTAQQASNGITLNGASLYGYQLKLGRPKQYIEYNKQLLSDFGSDANIDTILKKVNAMSGYADMNLKVEEKIICPPTRVLVLKHIVTIEQLAIDEEYKEISEDVLDMAKRFGTVVEMKIPRPHEEIDLNQVQERIKGLGLIFIKYQTVEHAMFARREFIKLHFSQRSVACSFLQQAKFQEENFDIVEKVIIDF